MKKILYTVCLVLFLSVGTNNADEGTTSNFPVPICENMNGYVNSGIFLITTINVIPEICKGINIGVIENEGFRSPGTNGDYAYFSELVAYENNIANFAIQLDLSGLVSTITGSQKLLVFEVVTGLNADFPVLKVALQKTSQIGLVNSENIWLMQTTWINPFTETELHSVFALNPNLTAVDINFNYDVDNMNNTYVAINDFIVYGHNQLNLPLGLTAKIGLIKSDAVLEIGDFISFSIPLEFIPIDPTDPLEDEM